MMGINHLEYDTGCALCSERTSDQALLRFFHNRLLHHLDDSRPAGPAYPTKNGVGPSSDDGQLLLQIQNGVTAPLKLHWPAG